MTTYSMRWTVLVLAWDQDKAGYQHACSYRFPLPSYLLTLLHAELPCEVGATQLNC